MIAAHRAKLSAKMMTHCWPNRRGLANLEVDLCLSRRFLAWGSMPGEGPKANNQVAGHTTRGPVSWTNLGAVAFVSAAAVAYFKIQRERRLEEAIGKIVTSESAGWTPDPANYAPRKFKLSSEGKWMPEEDQWGGSEFVYCR
jgi:hypothetical protein